MARLAGLRPAARGPAARAAHVLALASGLAVTLAEQTRSPQQASTEAALLDKIDAAILTIDREGDVIEWNPGAERLYGWTRSEMVGQGCRERIFPAGSVDEKERCWAELKRTGQWRGSFRAVRRDGSAITVHARTVATVDAAGRCDGYVCVAADISEALEGERRLRDAADYLEAVTNAVADGLFAIDVAGRVTFANDSTVQLLGYSREQLLGTVFHQLAHYRHADGTLHAFDDCPVVQARHADHVVRVDDDIFVRQDGSDLPIAYTAAPFHSGGEVSGCVVAFRDISEEKARSQRLRAVARNFRLADRVREALDKPTGSRGLELWAQPIVEIASGSLHFEELLLRMRWDGDAVLPGRFLSAAAQHGLMPQIDRWVLDQAITLARGGRAVALNLSSQAFLDFELLAEVELQLDFAAIDPALLMFEVAETSVIQDHDLAARFMTRLHESGCMVALDDFGAGSSGFTYLKSLPINYLKIDREFVRDLARNDASHHVVEAIVSLARSFGHRTIAEGVESKEVLQLLSDLGVQYAQGYFVGRPAPVGAPTNEGSIT
jgi:PAS domain S-box-containing protein